MEYASPERPVDSESPTASTDTALPEYAAGQRSNGGMFNLIIRKNQNTTNAWAHRDFCKVPYTWHTVRPPMVTVVWEGQTEDEYLAKTKR